MMNNTKGKTNIEIYGKEKAEQILQTKIKGIRSKTIICEDCNKKVQRTGTRQYLCKSCAKLRDNNSKQKWRRNNPKYETDYKKEYTKKNKKQIKLKNHEYYINNKDKCLKRTRKWQNKNKDKVNENKRNWRKNNPSKAKLEKIRRRARHKQIIETFTYKEWFQKVDSTKGICPKCKKFIGKNKLTLDHIIPISKAPKGFIYTINDVQPLCRSCNSKKKDNLEEKI